MLHSVDVLAADRPRGQTAYERACADQTAGPRVVVGLGVPVTGQESSVPLGAVDGEP